MNRLKELRGNKSQSQIASKLGIITQTYSNYESERREMDYSTLKHVADYYHVSIDYLLCHDIDAQNVANGINCGVVAAGNHNNFCQSDLGEIEREILKELENLPTRDKLKIYNLIQQIKGGV